MDKKQVCNIVFETVSGSAHGSFFVARGFARSQGARLKAQGSCRRGSAHGSFSRGSAHGLDGRGSAHGSRRASDPFNELKQLHKELKSSRSVHADKKDSSVSEKKKRPDSKDRTTDKTSLRVKFDDEQIGKTTMENGGNGNLEDVSGKRKGGGLKIEIEDKPSGKVEMDVESSDVVALLGSLLRFENNVAKGKSRKKLEDKKSLGDVKE
ncbi:glutamic acid-rich protein [Cucumis melo var. makuwa]|uniref:Glutamic acid-rich protein n=1 Tax=Cucumis melo var. makuwa TaxID=1194695 RepID=A0A5A7SXE2_CUCMM|nr:glutamic acid-rich protein [Cucumis melo var. makuwa]